MLRKLKSCLNILTVMAFIGEFWIEYFNIISMCSFLIGGWKRIRIEKVPLVCKCSQTGLPPHTSGTLWWSTKQAVVYQDNKSAILLENNGKLSSSKQTKQINVWYYFIKDCIERKEMRIEFCGTNNMWADFFTKLLQGKKFLKFRKIIMNLDD